MPKLYCALSSHGLGHLAQTAPVLNVLAERVPGLELVIHTTFPERVLERHLQCLFSVWSEPVDVGMVMENALKVDVEQSGAAYRHFHQGWEMRVQALAGYLRDWQADLVLSNVAYLPLLAATQADLPSVAMCSLNWADIYAGCCAGQLDLSILASMQSAYRGVDLFIQPAPSMAMTDVPQREVVAPIVQTGRERRGELRECLGLAADEQIVLVGFGGVPTRLALDPLLAHPEWQWLVPAEWGIHHDCFFEIESLDWSFQDVLRSVDILLTKPGYGAFAEAACYGIPVIYIDRPDWPETPYLTAWLEAHGRTIDMVWSDRWPVEIPELAQRVMSMPKPPPPSAQGAWQAAELIMQRMGWA